MVLSNNRWQGLEVPADDRGDLSCRGLLPEIRERIGTESYVLLQGSHTIEDPQIWEYNMVAFALHTDVLASEIEARIRRDDALALCFFGIFSEVDYFGTEFRRAFGQEFPGGGRRNKIEFTRSWLHLFFGRDDWVWFMPEIGVQILLQEGVIRRGGLSTDEQVVKRALDYLSPDERDVVWWALMQKRGDRVTEEFIIAMKSCDFDKPPKRITC